VLGDPGDKGSIKQGGDLNYKLYCHNCRHEQCAKIDGGLSQEGVETPSSLNDDGSEAHYRQYPIDHDAVDVSVVYPEVVDLETSLSLNFHSMGLGLGV
jgi:hypothetical protein